MLFGDIIAFFFHQINQYRLPYFSQIPGDDFVIIGRFTAKIRKVLFQRGGRRRRHTCSHIHGILQPIIHYFSHRHSRNPCSRPAAVSRKRRLISQHKRAAARHGPCGRQGPLVSVFQRKTKFLFRTGKMAGSDTDHFIRKSAGNRHGSYRQRLPAGGTSSVHAKQRYLVRGDTKGGCYGLPQQISRKDKLNILRFHLGLLHGQLNRRFLQTAFRLLPCLTAKHIVISHHIEKQPQRPLPFLGSHDAPAV